MARPDTNHEEKKAQIVEAALKTFANHGYEGTSNKIIAEEMKVLTGQGFSPALIYHYFPDGKAELFATVMQHFSPLNELSQAVQEDTEAPPEIFLRKVAQTFVVLFRSNPNASRLLRIIVSEAPRYPEIAQHLVGFMASKLLFPMFAYFIHQHEIGRLKPVQIPNTLFQFFGPLFFHVLMSDAVGKSAPFPWPSDDDVVENHVQAFLHGLALEKAGPEG